MKRMSAILVGLLCVALLASTLGAAEGGDRAKSSRVKFLRLTEQQVGNQEYLGVVVQQLEGTETATILVPMRRGEGGKMIRNEDLAAAARRLTPGQIVEVLSVTDGGQKWLKRIVPVSQRDGEKREGEVRRDGDAKREGEVRRDGDTKREGEVRREREKRDGEAKREGGDREGATVRREGGDREGATVRREGGDRVADAELKEQIKLLRQQVAEMEKALKELQAQIRQIKDSK